VRLFSDPGEIVWDPYSGSATTGVACLLSGRRFIGHESDSGYYDLGRERLRAATLGTTVRAERAGQTLLWQQQKE
jgi:DNA modification methylase